MNRILVVRRDNIGDLVCTTPLFSALRKRYPACFIGVLANSYNAPVLEGNPDLDAVYSYSKAKHGGASVLHAAWERLRLFRRLRHERYDVIVAFGPRAERIGRLLRTGRIVAPRAIEGVSEVEIVWTVASALGLEGAPPPLKVVPAADTLERARAAAPRGRGPLLGVHISARKRSQRWPLERHAELARTLHRRDGCSFLLFWAPGDATNPAHPGDDAEARTLVRMLDEVPLVPWPTDSLRDLIAGIAVCDRMVMSDGGAMHIAAALGKPIVAFFGRSDAGRWRPWGVPCEVLQPASLEAADVSVAEALAAYDRLRSA